MGEKEGKTQGDIMQEEYDDIGPSFTGWLFYNYKYCII